MEIFASLDLFWSTPSAQFYLFMWLFWRTPSTLKIAKSSPPLVKLFNLNGVARTQKKLHTPKGDNWIKQRVSSIVSLFKMGTSLSGKNLLPEGANSFLYEQFLIVWKITLSH